MNKEIFKGLKVLFYAQGTLDFKSIVDIFKEFQERR